ncbi:MAG TPA: hypothetical protein VH080_03245 [Gemmatimonadaceae bacterium]|jgi:hypothetical protein|nr:hypothetical protein [Gemmatimonadaceae bacterium]
MTDHEKSSEPERERPGQLRDKNAIIPDRHGKHGGSEESEGAPQEDVREAPPPRERDDTDRMKR